MSNRKVYLKSGRVIRVSQDVANKIADAMHEGEDNFLWVRDKGRIPPRLLLLIIIDEVAAIT